jgi:ABC-2 type transport system permease protein
MHSPIKNVRLIARREYLQRVRAKTFWFTTLLVPLMTAGFSLAPMYFATHEFGGQKRLVVVSDDKELAQSFADKLQSENQLSSTKAGENTSNPLYDISIDTDVSSGERDRLDSKILDGSIDSYIWLTRDALEKDTVEFHTKNATDLMSKGYIDDAVNFMGIRGRLAKNGVSNVDVAALLKPLQVQTLKVGEGKASSDNTYIFAFMLVFAMYLPVVIQVVAVMRSVIEEKTSRVMEVMLSAVTPKELMAGKIIGVGGVGLTQVLIWAALGAGVALFGFGAAGALQGVHFSAAMIVYFIIFYLLGFLLYSAFAAALGASVNSDEEAQQLQFFVMLPMILSMMVIGIIFAAPSSNIAIALSEFPFFAPILMYLRVVLEQPPLWQLALCIALLLATIYFVLSICARIYRVGILMYGKRPTLPEILRWIRYA